MTDEINEDNCVLDKKEIEIISDVFEICLDRLGLFGKSDTGIYLNTITLKIKKLNEMAKNKQLETLA